MKRIAILLYGVLAYLLFLSTFAYLIGFVGNILVPRSIEGSLTIPFWQAILINLSLILFFGLQHSIMARKWFKEWLTKFIPEAMERSTYVICTCIALLLIFTFWQPMGGIIWEVSNSYFVGVLYALFGLGWILVLSSSFMINHFDLFGLRQAWYYYKERKYKSLKFRIPILYEFVRHPLYLGILMAFWAAPIMSTSRLFFALVFTIYTLKGIQLEEKDMVNFFGDKYREYKSKVPMLLPKLIKRKPKEYVFKTIIKKEK